MAPSLVFQNNAVGQLLAGINTTATSFSLNPSEGANFPTTVAGASGSYMLVTIVKSNGQNEIIACTRSGDNFTVVDPSDNSTSVAGRGQENTSALTFSAGDRVELRPTAGAAQNWEDDIDQAEADIDAIEADYLTSAHVGADAHSGEYSLTSELWERSQLAAAGGGAPIHASHLTNRDEIDHSEITDDEEEKHRLIDDTLDVSGLTVSSYAANVFTFSGSPDLSTVTTDMKLLIRIEAEFGNSGDGTLYTITDVNDGTDKITVDSGPAAVTANSTVDIVDPEELYSQAKLESAIDAIDYDRTWKILAVEVPTGTDPVLVTGIPSGTMEIEILFNQLEGDTDNASVQLRLGDAGGIETTGYIGGAFDATALTSSPNKFMLNHSTSGDYASGLELSGVLRILRYSSNSTEYLISGNLVLGTNAGGTITIQNVAGHKLLSAELTQLDLQLNTGDLDGGEITVRYR